MTVTARTVITNALSFGLNRLSPGETLDADTAALALTALNDVIDELNGDKSQLFREVLTVSTAPFSGATGTLGTTWAGIAPGDLILGVTAQISSTLDTVLEPLTMAQYAAVSIKSIATLPSMYAYDGLSTVFFYPQISPAMNITLRTRQVASTFADLDTVYTLPAGWQAALSALLAERVAKPVVGAVPPDVRADAAAARRRLARAAINPAILGSGEAVPGGVAHITRGF